MICNTVWGVMSSRSLCDNLSCAAFANQLRLTQIMIKVTIMQQQLKLPQDAPQELQVRLQHRLTC